MYIVPADTLYLYPSGGEADSERERGPNMVGGLSMREDVRLL